MPEKKMSDSLVVVLKKMCDIVGADFDSIQFESDDWFLKHSWEEDQEKEFIDWMADYLYKNRIARLEMTKITNNTKRNCRNAAVQFVWNYGWRSR